ncbi:MAG TPA: peptide chain release factor-like protein [Syntrophales bacterium]|jgi:protein subunit release factor B|nr:peptide chain release factor-like protein [Syntrophales bacterium]HPX82051.1 peptide chain release factor-like protein [Syntrophales bacterium]
MRKLEYVFSLSKKDFTIQTFRAGGKGGQNQNKVESGVRIVHAASGAVGESRNFRDQLANKKAAFKRLVDSNKFRAWLRVEAAKRSLEIIERRRIEREVEEWMQDKYLKIETY